MGKYDKLIDTSPVKKGKLPTTLDDLYQEIWKIIDDLLSNMLVFHLVIVKLPNGIFIIWETTQQLCLSVYHLFFSPKEVWLSRANAASSSP